MKFLKSAAQKGYEKAYTRLSRVTKQQAVDWADASLWSVQEGLEGYRRAADRAALEQARLGVVGLLAAVDSLLDRTD